MINEALIKDLIEIRLKAPEDFLKVRETLTRMGVGRKSDKKLYQSCHILHKQKRYFIVHFKELLALDGKETNYSIQDKQRRNTIAGLLFEWGLIELLDASQIADKAPMSLISIIHHKEKHEWKLYTKYNIGGYGRNQNDIIS